MPEPSEQPNIEEQFRSSLEDVVEVAVKLRSYCETTDELIEMAKAALKSKGTLRMMIERIKNPD